MPTVALLPTCVVDTVAPGVGAAVVRVLRRAGFEVRVPEGVTCCGQPAWNAGFTDAAAKVARTTLDALVDDGADVVCVPAGSCATMLRVYWPQLFTSAGDPDAAARAERLAGRVREFSELVAEARAGGGRYRADVAYHHSCHMLRELGVSEQPERLLRELDGCTVAAWDGAERCCGFGGLFSVKQPELSTAMADDKLAGLLASGAGELVGCDTSCLLHLRGRLRRTGSTLPVRHLAEVLDEADGRA